MTECGSLLKIYRFIDSKQGLFKLNFTFSSKRLIDLSSFSLLLQLSNFRSKFNFSFCLKNYSNYLLIFLNFIINQGKKKQSNRQQQNQQSQQSSFMAFVFQTQRKVNEVCKLTNPVGPGQYFQQQNQRKTQLCAPFNSTGLRKTLFDEKPIVKAGPGQYDISKSIVEPNIKTVSNSHSIIVKINSTGTSEFKSGRQRFGRDETDVPGPGSYIQNQMQIKKRSFSSLSNPSKSASVKLKALTQSLKKYPAIPQKVRGLTDMRNDQQIPEQQKLGPGHYNPDKLTHLNLTSTVWGKDKTKRFSLDQTSNVGPGKYKLDFSRIQDKNNQPSSHFKSATVRTYFQSLYFKTNLDRNARQKDLTTFKTKDPAPGQYEVNKSSFQVKEKPFSFQFFGSTVERFSDEISQPSEKKRSATFYNLNSSIGKNNSFNKGNHGFNSEVERKAQFLNIKQRESLPGPGHYKQKTIVQRKLRGQKVQKFGSTTDRPFYKKQEPDEVGPGKYLNRQTNQQDQIIKSKFGQIKQTTSIFRSTTGRQCFSTAKGGVPLGQYDVSNTDISKKIEKQKNYLESLKKIEVEKAPFESANSRFPHYEDKKLPKQKKINNEDINKQHEQKIREQKQKVRSAIIEFNRTQIKQKEGKNYFGKSERFGSFKKGAPAVGHYKVETGFQKKTYNIKYANSTK